MEKKKIAIYTAIIVSIITLVILSLILIASIQKSQDKTLNLNSELTAEDSLSSQQGLEIANSIPTLDGSIIYPIITPYQVKYPYIENSLKYRYWKAVAIQTGFSCEDTVENPENTQLFMSNGGFCNNCYIYGNSLGAQYRTHEDTIYFFKASGNIPPNYEDYPQYATTYAFVDYIGEVNGKETLILTYPKFPRTIKYEKL